jgi:hypothetical protein
MTKDLLLDLVARVHARCVDCAGCLIWQRRQTERQPYIHVKRKHLSARRVMYEYMHGSIPEKHDVTSGCEHPWCMRHLIAVTRSGLNQRMAARGAWKNPARKAKIAAAQQANRSDLDLENILDIRFGPGSLREAALRNGCSKSCAAAIRRGERWRDYSNPYMQLGARA